MEERSIVYIDWIRVHVGHNDANDLTDGMEIHVRREDGKIDILYVAPDAVNVALLDLRCNNEFWGRFANYGDVFMQALDPQDE
jgi:hypothetical protein